MNDSNETENNQGETEDLPPTASGWGKSVEKSGSEIGPYKILSVLGEGAAGWCIWRSGHGRYADGWR